MLEMYGAQPGDGSFASNCLLARRLAERGVRFIQLYHRDWDHHSAVKPNIALKAEEVDKPTAALITDLKQRGMLDDTLIVWGGEFGRTPMSQGGDGRDHHIKGFSFVLAGGGIKGGITYGATDDFGYAAAGEPRQRARFPRHHAAPAGHRPQAPGGEVPGPGRAADGHFGRCGEGYSRVTKAGQKVVFGARDRGKRPGQGGPVRRGRMRASHPPAVKRTEAGSRSRSYLVPYCLGLSRRSDSKSFMTLTPWARQNAITPG